MVTKEELERLTKDQLFAMAKDAGLAGFETMNKKDLIDAILNTPSVGDTKSKPALTDASNAVGKAVDGPLDIVILQYNGVSKGSLTKYGKTWSNVARRTVSRAEAQMLINEFPGRFTIVR